MIVLVGRVYVHREWPTRSGYYMVLEKHEDHVVVDQLFGPRQEPFPYYLPDFKSDFRPFDADVLHPIVAARYDKEWMKRWRLVKQ